MNIIKDNKLVARYFNIPVDEIKAAKVSKPLQSRFMRFYLSKYTEQEFLNVAEKVLPKLSPSIARYIGAKIYQAGGDIRAVINTERLIKKDDGPTEIAEIISTLNRYSEADNKCDLN